MGKRKLKRLSKKHEALDYQVKIIELEQRLAELQRTAPKIGFHQKDSNHAKEDT